MWWILFALPLALASTLGDANGANPEATPPAGAAIGTYDRPPLYDGVESTSFHIVMDDGTRIAATLSLPRGLAPGATLPTILRQTRYYRDISLRFPFNLLHENPRQALTRYFVPRGYAWVDVDVRGTGASFGVQDAPWSPREVKDGGLVVDWIVAQSWSNGSVGATGVSYDGTASELLLVNQHPAVKAVAPTYSLFDTYLDIAFPGGVHLSWLTKSWGELNRALDGNRVGEFLGFPTSLVLLGVLPIDGDDGTLVTAAALGRDANWDPHECALLGAFRDDVVVDRTGRRLHLPSPHLAIDRLRASKAAVYGISGWYDGGYAHAAIKRFLNVENPGSRVLIGPWNHGGDQNVSPFAPSRETAFNHRGELLRFFDHHVGGRETGIDQDLPFVYYTLGEERWKAAASWPPRSLPTTWFLGAERALTREPPALAFDDHAVDTEATSGVFSRWHALLSPPDPIGYFDRREQDGKLQTYTSAPLGEAMEVTGHPEVRVRVQSLAGAKHLFAYLEDVAPDGSVTYVTEGVLGLTHRKVSSRTAPYVDAIPYHSYERGDALPVTDGAMELVISLQPTSYQFRAGHRLRLAFAGADKDHVETPARPGLGLRFFRGGATPSRITLPVVSREDNHARKPR